MGWLEQHCDYFTPFPDLTIVANVIKIKTVARSVQYVSHLGKKNYLPFVHSTFTVRFQIAISQAMVSWVTNNIV